MECGRGKPSFSESPDNRSQFIMHRAVMLMEVRISGDVEFCTSEEKEAIEFSPDSV